MEDDIDYLKPAKVYFMDTNLSSPVLLTEIDSTKELLNRTILFAESSDAMWKGSAKERSEFHHMRKLCSHNKWTRSYLRTSRILDPSLYPMVEEDMLKCTNYDGCYEEAKTLAHLLESAAADGLEARGLPRAGIEGVAATLGGTAAVPYRNAYEAFTDLFSRAESRVKNNEHAWTYAPVGEVEYWIHPSYSLIRCRGQLYHSSLNQVLMLKDKLATRYMMIEHVGALGLESSLLTYLSRLFKWQDSTLQHYGNQAYGILKAVEPMFKTRLSHVTDNVFGNDTAYTRMIAKMREKETKVRQSVGTSYSSMSQLIDLVESVKGLDNLVELFGCQKSCGHPLIDAARGGLSAAEEARTPDVTSFIDAQKLRNTFCHIILTTYIERHGKWPDLEFLKSGTRLEILAARQERSLTRGMYDLTDWNVVEWKKLFDMDYFPNFLELMDDKSISYYKSEKHLSWDKDKKPRSERRLLLEVLKRPEISIEKLVKKISTRQIPDDWLIVSLYPKEREFKEDPRMFAMLVLEMRCFFTCVEANIADHVFKYLPQQTMTKTKTQIQERFLSFTDPNKRAQAWTLFLEIDLSRWNLKWRELVIHMLGHDLNRMFGVKGTFTITHWFFKRSQIVVRVGGLRPEGIEKDLPPETALAWRNHLGGFEGLNQKLWTAATYAMVEMALAPLLETGAITDYELIGQGDNQVIRVSIPVQNRPREEVIPGIRDELNRCLEETCTSVGQEVKPEENIESTSVLTYSKDVYIGGVEYPTSLKKHSRLFPVTATDFPSLPMKASAIMAGAVAGAENARHPLRSAVIGWYHTARYLIAAGRGRSIHGSNLPRFSPTDVLLSLIAPPSVGGLIGTPIASFMYKGGSDPLGKEISSLRLLADSKSEAGNLASQVLRGLEERYCVDPEPNLETLIDNPYSLPIDKRASPISRVSHLTLDAFRRRVQNRDIQPLLETKISQAERTLKEDILSMRPLNPLLAHDLFDASAFGTIKIMRKMFLTTRTVQTVAQIVNPNITHQFLRSDINDIEWFRRWGVGLPKRGYSGRQSYDLVKSFRQYWQVDLHGVTNYQPLDYYHQSGSARNPSSIKWSAHSASDLLRTRGPLPGYLGTATREKRSEHGYKIVDAGAPSRAMMKLQLIRSQAYGDLNLNTLLDRIGLTRTNLRLSDVTDLLQKVIGGSIAHRYATAIRNMAASYVGPLNFITHIRLDTDSLGKISGSSFNYPIMTQEFMIMTLLGAKLMNLYTGSRIGELVVHTDEMEALPEDSLSAKKPKFEVSQLPRSKLAYTENLLIARTYDSVAQQVPRGAIAHTTIYHEKETVEQGAIGFFMDLLRDANKAKALADTRGLTSIPARLQVDIAEAHALGPRTLLKCMAYAIITSYLRDTFRTLHLHPERWDEELFLMHSILTCVRSCSTYWRHPLFYGHKDSEKFRSSPLKYAGWMTSDRVLIAEVRRLILMLVSSPSHKFWKTPIPTFAGEHSMSVSEALTTAGAKILYPLYIDGSEHATEFGNLFSSFSRLPVKKTLTPDEQLSLLRARMVKLSTIYSKHGDLITARRIKALGHLEGVVVFNDDFRTVLRYARELTVEKGTIRESRVKRFKLDKLNRDHCLSCLPEQKSRLSVMWNKYAGRSHGGVTSSGYTWANIVGELHMVNQAVIIGSGNGGLADLLIRAYQCDVIGVDLEEDLPKDSATLLNYTPLGLSLDLRHKFTESDLCLTTTGDWKIPSVRTEILTSICKKSTVFIDITDTANLNWVDMLEDTLQHQNTYKVYARLIADRRTIASIVTPFRDRRQLGRMWCISASYSSDELIIELEENSYHLHQCQELPALIYLNQRNGDILISPRKAELFSAAACSSISYSDQTIEEFRDLLQHLCRRMLNKKKSRQLLYRDRISLILGYATFTAATSDNPVSLIQEWISEEEIATDVFTIPMRDAFTNHLLRYVPRLLSLQG